MQDEIIKSSTKSLRGVLRQFAKPELQASENDAWINEISLQCKGTAKGTNKKG